MGKPVIDSRRQRVFTAVMWLLAIAMLYPFVMMVVIGFRPAGLAYKPLFSPVKPIWTTTRRCCSTRISGIGTAIRS